MGRFRWFFVHERDARPHTLSVCCVQHRVQSELPEHVVRLFWRHAGKFRIRAETVSDGLIGAQERKIEELGFLIVRHGYLLSCRLLVVRVNVIGG